MEILLRQVKADRAIGVKITKWQVDGSGEIARQEEMEEVVVTEDFC
jgi:hypothetical protein